MWKCKKCGKEGRVVEDTKLVQHYELDKDLKWDKQIASGGYGTHSHTRNRMFKCTYCGAEQFNDINKLAEWVEGDKNDN